MDCGPSGCCKAKLYISPGIPELMVRALAIMYELLLASDMTLKALVEAIDDKKSIKLTH
jgi:hypothetical protein